jgi:hypothetical protein
MGFFKINKKLMFRIFIIEALLCSTELVMAINNYISNTEQWQWFFTFIANLPASIILGSILKITFEKLAVESFNTQVILSYIVYLIGGTLWWTFLVQGIATICRALQKIDKGNT